MKILSRTILVILICLLFVSCSVTDNSSNESAPDPHENSVESYHYELEQTEKILLKIIECFDNKDKESIKAMFSVKIAKEFDLDSLIDKAFEIYNGKSVSYEINKGSTAGSAKTDGTYTFLEYDGKLENIKMDNSKSFSIRMSRCVVNDDDPDEIGLTRITLRRDDGVKLAPIGKVSQNDTFYEYDAPELP